MPPTTSLNAVQLFEALYSRLQTHWQAKAVVLPQPQVIDICIDDQDGSLVHQQMFYQQFLSFNINGHTWFLCFGKNELSAGDPFVADLSLFQFFRGEYELEEGIAQVCARLCVSQNFNHSLLVANSEQNLGTTPISPFASHIHPPLERNIGRFLANYQQSYVDIPDQTMREVVRRHASYRYELVEFLLQLFTDTLCLFA